MTKVKEQISLSKFSNYKIGGPARFLLAAKTEKDITEGVKLAKAKRQKLFILGGGTNLLISDAGFDGFVIKPEISFIKKSGNKISVGSGASLGDFLKFAAKNKLQGVEWAGGLPGTVGGAIYGNAGAFGGEIKDSLESVRSFNIQDKKFIERNNKDCKFSYRSSVFKENRGQEIIVSATFGLNPGNQKAIQASIDEKVKYRIDRQPLEYPNVGSIFKNVDVKKFPKAKLKEVEHVVKLDPFPVIPTAHLISEVGLKGVSFGGAMISPKHPNFIVNSENATASDVLALISLVKAEVKKKFSVNLEEEVQMVS